jgi:hypothetical protein
MAFGGLTSVKYFLRPATTIFPESRYRPCRLAVLPAGCPSGKSAYSF